MDDQWSSDLGSDNRRRDIKKRDCTKVRQDREKKKFKYVGETTSLLSAYFGAPLIHACVRVRGAS